MSRFYQVNVVLRDTDPEVRKISARFELPEEQADLGYADVLWEAFKGCIAAIKDADKNGPPESDPVVNV